MSPKSPSGFPNSSIRESNKRWWALSDGSREREPDERPVHEVYVDAFWIDRYLVTNAYYARFLNVFGDLHSRQFNEKEVNGE